MKHLSAIKGINELLQALPEEYQHFYRFGTILKLEIKKSFDLETWNDVYNGTLIVADETEHYKIQLQLKNIHGALSFYLSEPLSGFAICDMAEDGYEPEVRFRVYDFEQQDFSIYCEEIEAVLLQK